MECRAVQNRILMLPDPRRVTETLRAHIAECPGCQAWCQQAGNLEGMIEKLPVPAAPRNKKRKLIVDLSRSRPASPSSLEAAPASQPWLTSTAIKYAGGLAAAVLVVLGGWRLLHHPETRMVEVAAAPRHPLLDKVVQRDLALARATTPEKRLEVLGGLAEDLRTETRDLALVARADEMKDVARWFEKVVQGGIVKQAGNLPDRVLNPTERAERQAILDRLAAQLGDAGRDADRAAAQAPPDAQDALRRIAETAKKGQEKLRDIAQRGS